MISRTNTFLPVKQRRKDRELLRRSLLSETYRKSMDLDNDESCTLQVLEEMEEFADSRKSASYELQSIEDIEGINVEDREKTSSL